MIRLIECRNYRCLKYISQPLDNFQILVGPNASGKTTFLDVVKFLADIVSVGVDKAITDRSANYNDLTFGCVGGDIELAIEAIIPPAVRLSIDYQVIRYEIRIGLNEQTAEHEIIAERALIMTGDVPQKTAPIMRSLFPEAPEEEPMIINKKFPTKVAHQVLRKQPGGNDNFYPENRKDTRKTSGGWMPSFKLGPKRSALGNFPADLTKFPATAWLKDYLIDGIQLFILDSLNIRKASAPGQGKRFRTDGSNLPWVIEDLKKHPDRFDNWINHLQTALPDIADISTVEREDDKHRYLRIQYNTGVVVPSWLASDGTLRLLALTLPAYLPDFTGVYLIEEPENGIHPKAIETVYQSLSSVYSAQILLASHSPVILSQVEAKEVLCFAKTEDGITDIISGDKHPNLHEWKGETNLGTLYAAGVLG